MSKISIVTINWNNRDGLHRTLQSVADQTHRDFEYLVIDGNSTDGSKDLISEYSGYIDYSVSEPDGGIYDAMLKGARKARGEWIWFLNSGDILSSSNAAEEMSKALRGGVDIFYADYLVKYPDGFVARRSARDVTPDNIWRGMPTSHQACLVSRAAILRVGFEKSHGFAADFGQILAILSSGGSAVRVHCCPVMVEAGGISDRRRIESTMLHTDIALANSRSIMIRLYWMRRLLDQYIRVTLKRLLPLRLTVWLRSKLV